MRISDWSSDVCSSDLGRGPRLAPCRRADLKGVGHSLACNGTQSPLHLPVLASHRAVQPYSRCSILGSFARSEEHTSELQSLMRISYAVFCLKNKKTESNTHRMPHHDAQDNNQLTT